MSIYITSFDKTTCMYFVIKDDKCFHRYMKNLGKISNIIKKN